MSEAVDTVRVCEGAQVFTASQSLFDWTNRLYSGTVYVGPMGLEPNDEPMTPADSRGDMNRDELIEKAQDPKYIAGIYNYCDRWCERCPFTSRCLNCTLMEEQAGDLAAVDITNEEFWNKFSEILQGIRELVEEMAREEGIDLDAMAAEDDARGDKEPPPDIISHLSKKYAAGVSGWFHSNEYALQAKEAELNRIQLVSFEHHPAEAAFNIADAIEVIRWYQHQIHVKLSRAFESAVDEALHADDLPKDSDGSAKVALIGIDRSMAAWKILAAHLAMGQDQMMGLIELLENLRRRVENRFPMARRFVRPGFDENPGVTTQP